MEALRCGVRKRGGATFRLKVVPSHVITQTKYTLDIPYSGYLWR